jgi:hypothetical protein
VRRPGVNRAFGRLCMASEFFEFFEWMVGMVVLISDLGALAERVA